ncbi:MAG: FAD-binding molybdopterin dehydrogenase, partial [Thermoplasmata archaeon]
MKSFEYHETRSVQETIEILSSEEETRILAGGCGLLLLIKEKLFVPRAIVNIKKIPGLKYVTQKNGHIAIGTLTTHNEVKDAPAVAEKIPLLSEALGYVATDRIRNMA